MFEILDELPLWQVELVWEYGHDRAMRAFRECRTPEHARAFLELERQMLEYRRWCK
jgi:hypothetical protein